MIARIFPVHHSHTTCVVIPARNEQVLLGRCIQSVLDAGVPAEDIYVVDDASTDKTAAVASAFSGVNTHSNAEALGKLDAVKHIIDRCALLDRYEYLALLDADSYVSANYFHEVQVSFTADANRVLVCGAPQSERYNWLTAYRAAEYEMALRVYKQAQHWLGTITVAPGCASTYRTSILRNVDWGGRTLVEDMDLTIQIHRKQLGRIAYTAGAVTHTQDPRTIREYCGQVTRWYRGTWQVALLHKLPFGGQPIDAEFGVLAAEGLFFSLITMLSPLLAWFRPAIFMQALAADQAIWFVFAALCALRLRRIDILLAFPTFIGIRLANSIILLRTFWLEVVLKKREHRWFSVSRYERQLS